MQIRDERHSGVVVVSPAGRVDTTTSGPLEQHLTALIGANERRFVIDFAEVDYISSAGLRVMLLLAKRIKELGGKLALCAMRESVRQVFDLAGFMAIFTIEPSREAAVGRVKG